MTALSFWQPYAWFIVNGHADVDSRTWAPPDKRLGERIAIHASKRKLTLSEFEDFLAMVKELKIKNYPKTKEEFDYGAVVGSAVIESVSRNSKSYFAHRGYFHWKLRNAKTVTPVPVKGQRGWFTVTV